MAGFERGDVVLNHTAEAHDFDRMRSQRLLMVIPQSYEKKKPRQERDDGDANRGPRQELEMKMLWAEKPGDASSENPSTYLHR